MVYVVIHYVLYPLLASGMVVELALHMPVIGLPAALLAGVLERPFVGKNGPGRHVVWYAIQANLVSLLLVYCWRWIEVNLRFPPKPYQLGMWGPILLFLLIVLVEYCYLALRGVIRWRRLVWIVLGNYFSGFVIGLVSMALFMWYQELPSLRLGAWHEFLSIVAWVVSITGCLLAFAVPWWRSKRRAAAGQVSEPSSTPV